MRSGLIQTVVVVTMFAGICAAADDAVTAHLGKKIANVTFTAADGKTTQLHDLTNKKAIVIAFLSFECPVSKSYMQPLSDMATELESQGVALIGLTVNQDETPAEVAKQVSEYKPSFPIYLDKQYAATDALA